MEKAVKEKADHFRREFLGRNPDPKEHVPGPYSRSLDVRGTAGLGSKGWLVEHFHSDRQDLVGPVSSRPTSCLLILESRPRL